MWAWDDVNVDDVRRRAGLTEDEERTRENPLNVAPTHALHDAFERMEMIDGELTARGLHGRQATSPDQYSKGIEAGRAMYGGMESVSISELISTEPALDGAHLDALLAGNQVQTSSKTPIVYMLSDGYWIVDGNHRIAAEHLKGNSQVQVFLVDLLELETELFS